MGTLARRAFKRALRIGASALAASILAGGAGSCSRASDEPRPARQAAATDYSCPMHPEVTQAGPGKCRNCGMVLARSEHTHDHDHGARPEVQVQPHADHNPKHGGMFGMQGDYHLELAVRDGGRIEFYLYDAYTKPLPLQGVRASVVLEVPSSAPGESRQVTVPLVKDAAGAVLQAQAPEADRAVSATVKATLPDTLLSMTFYLQETLTGEVIDVDCYVRLGERGRGPQHSACARACIENGLPVGLSVGNTIYLLTLTGEPAQRAANERLASLAGKKIRVTGRIIEASQVKILALTDFEEVLEGS